MPPPAAKLTPLPLPLGFRVYCSFYKAQMQPLRIRLAERAEWLVAAAMLLSEVKPDTRLTYEQSSTAGILADRLNVMIAEMQSILQELRESL